MTQPNVLIACIGNIFLGDDGFGVEVARRLITRPLPPRVTVKDFGIRSFDLAYALLEPYQVTILVDACARGGAPGSLYLIEPDPIADDYTSTVEAHGMNPTSVLRLVKTLGGTPPRILVVGCEPLDLGTDDEGKLGLSEPVTEAVNEAVVLIERLVEKIVKGVPQGESNEALNAVSLTQSH